MKLTERARKIFAEALTNPPKPNAAAIAAAKRFSQEVEPQPFSGPTPSRLPNKLKPRRAAYNSLEPPLSVPKGRKS
jgi:hypothetical protein